MKIITINDVEYAVFAANEGTVKSQPHMIETLSGTVPEGKQLSLLKEYLKQNDIVLIKGATTHWCIDKALKLGSSKEKNVIEKAHEQQYLPLTEENIEEQHKVVGASSNYGKEGLIIHDVLNAFPLHNDLNTIAMKIAVIDVTNSTHLSQYKSKLSLYDLAKVILDIPNFDERLAKGDPDLVNIIARNIGAVNMFSFASKYCTYHLQVNFEGFINFFRLNNYVFEKEYKIKNHFSYYEGVRFKYLSSNDVYPASIARDTIAYGKFADASIYLTKMRNDLLSNPAKGGKN
ncbi:hypothetical protein [Clostridium algidicarnis]|uniref:hypothetical protein n=1 Tax=Clostridium algidicarnis TaxID=37659 RepID=UPI001A9B4850|nr:hypothetical protein [Clostridium algidicarnis]